MFAAEPTILPRPTWATPRTPTAARSSLGHPSTRRPSVRHPGSDARAGIVPILVAVSVALLVDAALYLLLLEVSAFAFDQVVRHGGFRALLWIDACLGVSVVWLVWWLERKSALGHEPRRLVPGCGLNTPNSGDLGDTVRCAITERCAERCPSHSAFGVAVKA